MRILDFADGFASASQPALTSLAASGISVTPSGNLSSTDVQSALVELQTDIDGRQVTITGGASTIATSNLTVSKALASNASGKVVVSTTTDTELGYVSGVTSAIQTQLNGKQATGNYITDLTGDITASGPGSSATTLATVNATTGSFGSSSAIPNFTVNAKGLITAAGTSAVIAPAGTLTGTTLASNVVSSSLTSVGTLTTGTWSATTIAVNKGGTGQTAFTDGQLLIGNTSTTGLTKATLSAGTGINITNAGGSITIASTGTAGTSFNYLAKTANYTAVANDYVKCSSASFAVTLPTAVGVSGQIIAIEHAGLSDLSQSYAINTTSAQTVAGLATGVYILQTKGEIRKFMSDGANWLLHASVISAASVSWTPMFSTKFTITSGNATAGAVYTNNSQTFVVIQTVAASVSVQMVGTGNPAASGSLSKTSGVGDASLTFSAFANANGTVTTVNAWWMRYSNRMKAWGSFLPGTATANLFAMSLPGPVATPIALDTTQLAPSNNIITNPGMKVGTLNAGGTGAFYNFVAAPGTNASMLFDGNISSGTTPLTPQTAQTGITSGALASWDFDIAVSGWQP